MESQDNGARVLEDYDEVRAAESALTSAAAVRGTIAEAFAKLTVPREFTRHVTAIGVAITRGAELVRSAAEGADEAYSACSSYSYSTTTARSCPATLGSSKSYRQFLLSAKEQAIAYDTAVAAFRQVYERAVRELYTA